MPEIRVASSAEQQDVREATASRLQPEPMDPQLTSIQPGGGFVMRLELAWGRVRRWSLKTFRKRHVARMRELRRGEQNGCPHEVLDPRDLKYFRNRTGCSWAAEDDPFAWRDRLPFARDGLAELLVISLPCFAGAALLAWLTAAQAWTGPIAWLGGTAAAALAIVGLLVVWFFRDPPRSIPQEPGAVVSPADGKVVAVDELNHDEFLEGPAVRIGIFLSIFNVHINRVPAAARVIGLRYQPGKCLNALRPESARENEQLHVKLEENIPPHRRFVVTQITGAIARRIVCRLKPGDELDRGAQFGMIKLGSRTELVLPREEGLAIKTRVGETVRAGTSILAHYEVNPPSEVGG